MMLLSSTPMTITASLSRASLSTSSSQSSVWLAVLGELSSYSCKLWRLDKRSSLRFEPTGGRFGSVFKHIFLSVIRTRFQSSVFITITNQSKKLNRHEVHSYFCSGTSTARCCCTEKYLRWRPPRRQQIPKCLSSARQLCGSIGSWWSRRSPTTRGYEALT